ncbi:hypothetical protein WICPIJ_006754 [Wickerhamomyces pijperi]|uniref:Uncharacterized protein n=1 Tax=Wickerhamomyces pijperi TaxID=599730 RepID=A0A9P8Q3F3_WICPI|nr:hypothetical protein WICPIJ_006754 [Wickerhamomyces pijperi]
MDKEVSSLEMVERITLMSVVEMARTAGLALLIVMVSVASLANWMVWKYGISEDSNQEIFNASAWEAAAGSRTQDVMAIGWEFHDPVFAENGDIGVAVGTRLDVRLGNENIGGSGVVQGVNVDESVTFSGCDEVRGSSSVVVLFPVAAEWDQSMDRTDMPREGSKHLLGAQIVKHDGLRSQQQTGLALVLDHSDNLHILQLCVKLIRLLDFEQEQIPLNDVAVHIDRPAGVSGTGELKRHKWNMVWVGKCGDDLVS